MNYRFEPSVFQQLRIVYWVQDGFIIQVGGIYSRIDMKNGGLLDATVLVIEIRTEKFFH